MSVKCLRKILFLSFIVFLGGCGYASKVTLPYKDAKTIYIPVFRNNVPPERMFTYLAGLELAITQAVSNDFAKDGNLKVVDKKDADLILRGELIRYEQEAYRFNRFENVDQFRLFVVVKLILEDAHTGKTIWVENDFSGNSFYFVSGPRQTLEDSAAQKSINNLSESIVNRVVEEW